MTQDGIMRVALNDTHVQVVQTLAHDVEDAWSNFVEIGIL